MFVAQYYSQNSKLVKSKSNNCSEVIRAHWQDSSESSQFLFFLLSVSKSYRHFILMLVFKYTGILSSQKD